MDMDISNSGTNAVGALFIDFDNIYQALRVHYKQEASVSIPKTIQIIGKVNSYLRDHEGVTPIIRMAFADWSIYPDVLNELYTMGIKVFHAKATVERESADIELSLALQEIMLTRPDIGNITVVAGDRDYMPVCHRARDKGRRVLFFSFAETLSGDLRRLLGDENCFFLDPLTTDIVEEQEEAEVSDSDEEEVAEDEDDVSAEEEASEGVEDVSEEPQEAQVEGPAPQVERTKELWLGLDADQLKTLRAAIRAFRNKDPKYEGIKVSKFLVMDLSVAMPDLEHLERKKVFNSLVDKGIIQVVAKTSAFGELYAIFKMSKDHPTVREVMETLND